MLMNQGNKNNKFLKDNHMEVEQIADLPVL